MTKSANAIITEMSNEAKAEREAKMAERGGEKISFFTNSTRTINGSEVKCYCDPCDSSISWKIDGKRSSKAKVKAFIES